MSDLVMGSDLNAMVEAYLSELSGALSRLPASRRDQLVSEIREHITERRSERPPRDRSDMEALLNRVGLPEDIAAVALEDMEEPASDIQSALPPPAGPPRWHHRFSNRVLVGAAAGALVLVVVVAGIVATGRSTSVTRSQIVPAAAVPRPPRLPGQHVSVVPVVIGESQAAAAAELAALGFTYSAIDVSSTAPAGIVVSQSPAGGASQPIGADVVLTVSSGPGSSS
ncbi:MAG TPA: PASTA domain-containing protein [Acidimicrobiales bacterium]|jgi:hypothetical protein|nr:PASTA domain-containing protein [Acidimicrobiales bacterium]